MLEEVAGGMKNGSRPAPLPREDGPGPKGGGKAVEPVAVVPVASDGTTPGRPKDAGGTPNAQNGYELPPTPPPIFFGETTSNFLQLFRPLRKVAHFLYSPSWPLWNLASFFVPADLAAANSSGCGVW